MSGRIPLGGLSTLDLSAHLDPMFIELYALLDLLVPSSGNVLFGGTSDYSFGFNPFGTLQYNLYVPASTDSAQLQIRRGATKVLKLDSAGNAYFSATGDVNAGVGISPTGNINIGNAAGVSGFALAGFYRSKVAIGSITQSGTTGVSYNTTSDYRLKPDPQPLTGSGSFIDALRPCTWLWAQDGSRGVGFIAHEFAEVSPTSVVGEKDAVDAEGQPVYQAMDASSPEVMANIIAELQDLRRRVALIEDKTA